MSLFKARGKYDDLATGDATARISSVVRENLSRTTALSLSEMKQDSASKPAHHGSGKKDMGAALRSRNPQAVQSLIEKKGLGVCFKAGSDGVTPIELAFANGNVECGRVMLKAIQDALNSKDYEMDKADTEEEKNDVARNYVENAAFSSTLPVTRGAAMSVAPIMQTHHQEEVAAPRRGSIEERIRRFSDPKQAEQVHDAAPAQEERHMVTEKVDAPAQAEHHEYYHSEELMSPENVQAGLENGADLINA